MRKVVIGIMVMALLALGIAPAIADTFAGGVGDTWTGDSWAEVEISLEVMPYAEVTWGDPSSGTFTILPPVTGAPWYENQNWLYVPITVKSNCDVNLDVSEGLSQLLVGEGIPWAGMWNDIWEASFPGDYTKMIFNPGISIMSTAGLPTNPQGPCFAYSDVPQSYAGSPANVTYALPDGSGTGLHAVHDLNYGVNSMGPAGPAGLVDYIYDGTFESWIVIMCGSVGGTLYGKDWTSLPATTAGTFNLYAQVSLI